MKVVAIVQARMGSTRLPGKVLKKIRGIPMIELMLDRLSQSKRIDQILVATSTNPENQPLIDHVTKLGYTCEAGSESDVLDRYYQAAAKHQADIVVRVTGDCPLIDADVVDQCIERYLDSDSDYCSNVVTPTYPDGLDTEVFSFSALEKAATCALEPAEREHVTPYIRNSELFRKTHLTTTPDYSGLRWTVDEAADFEVISNVFNTLGTRYFSWQEVLRLQEEKPELFAANLEIKRNEGEKMNNGPKLWKRAKNLIPGGNMLLSKRPEMFLPDLWPSYFSKAKGCTVWDLDGRAYTDMSIMGIGTNTLGYGHPEVDAAVSDVIQSGNMSTFNAPEEVYLAEKLIELHPWADMARFARSGGEANAIAIRIARAASGKDKVAVCGYHGWHDWYLSANLGDDENLAGHLLPGLEPNGVPGNLKGTVYPFNYNDFEGLLTLVNKHDIGVIKMEVVRNMGPENNFLHKVRELATQKGIVLIFDECTSGFRETFGGLHKKYGVEPDMAMFGKALGNGYAVTATIGRREVMQAAQTSFISSTFWTERIGSRAGNMAIEINFELSDSDLAHFRAMMDKVISKTSHYSESEILTKAQQLVDEMEKSELPEFVRTRMVSLAKLIEAVQDEEWQIPEEERKDIIASLAYFSEPEDVVPDNIPGLGYIDDAIMIELVLQDMSLDLKAYSEFCSFRATEESRRGDDAKVDRESWLAGTRAQIRSNMRRQRQGRKSRLFSRIM